MDVSREYKKIMKKVSCQERLKKSLDLSDLTKQLFLTGLKNRYPGLDDKKITEIYIERIKKCSRQSY